MAAESGIAEGKAVDAHTNFYTLKTAAYDRDRDNATEFTTKEGKVQPNITRLNHAQP